jgi:hypothetical protein
MSDNRELLAPSVERGKDPLGPQTNRAGSGCHARDRRLGSKERYLSTKEVSGAFLASRTRLSHKAALDIYGGTS